MINLEKAREAMEQIFTVNLEKEAVKQGVAHDLYSAIKFVPDISGSMQGLYNRGRVQETLERLFVVALGLDDDGSMQVFPFSNKCEQLEKDVTIENYRGFVDKEIMNNRKSYYWSGTEYLSFLKEIEKDYKANNKKKLFSKTKVMPSLVLSIVDGDTCNRNEVANKIKELAKLPIFFIFFGLGTDSFSFLEQLDTMTNRYVDNTAFYNVNDIARLSDEELYNKISEQFIPWFYEMKKRGDI